MNEDEDELLNPEEEGGCEDGTSTGTRKEGNQPDSTNPPFFRLALSEHLSSLQQGSSSQTTGDTINTLLDLLQQANSSDKSCVDIVSMGFVPLLFQKLDQSGRLSAKPDEEVVRLCVLIVLNLTAVLECHSTICKQDGIRLLCYWLTQGGDITKGFAAVALGNLATNASTSARIGEAGAIDSLIRYIHESKTSQGIEKAVGSLWNLVSNHTQNKRRVAAAGGVYSLVVLLKGGGSTMQEYAAGTVAKLSSESSIAAELIDHGVIKPLTMILTTGNDMRKQHACLAIRNLAVKSKAKKAIPAAKGIEPLIALLTTGTKRCQLDAVAALGNLATTAQNRALIADMSAVPPLVKLLQDEKSKDIWPKLCTTLNEGSAFLSIIITTDDNMYYHH